MALYDKHHAIQFGIPAGIAAHEDGGEKLLYFSDVPYEFRDYLLPEWVSARGWRMFESPTCVMRTPSDSNGLAYTWLCWEAFVDWMTMTLDSAAVAMQHANGITESEVRARMAAPCVAELRAATITAAQTPPATANTPRAFKGGLINGVPIVQGSFGAARYLRDIPLEWCSPLLAWLAAQRPNALSGNEFESDGEGAVRISDNLFDDFCQWSGNVLQEAVTIVRPAPLPDAPSGNGH
jgi:hypothetical protein